MCKPYWPVVINYHALFKQWCSYKSVLLQTRATFTKLFTMALITVNRQTIGVTDAVTGGTGEKS